MTPEKIEFSISKATFWILLATTLAVYSGSLIGFGAWITSVQKDILQVKADIKELEQSGSIIALKNKNELDVLKSEIRSMEKSFALYDSKNDKAHDEILKRLQFGGFK
jgi:cell division protein FtsL